MVLALLRCYARWESAQILAESCCRCSLSTLAWSWVKSWLPPWRCRSFGSSGRIQFSYCAGFRRVQLLLCCLAVFGSWSESGSIESRKRGIVLARSLGPMIVWHADLSKEPERDDEWNDVFSSDAGQDSTARPSPTARGLS